MKGKKVLSILMIISISMFSCHKNDIVKDGDIIDSPSHDLDVKLINADTTLSLNVIKWNTTLVRVHLDLASTAGLFKAGYKIETTPPKMENTIWHPVYGERSQIINHYNEAILKIIPIDDPKDTLEIICRAYDDMFAFRYCYNGEAFDQMILQDEKTIFEFNNDLEIWATGKAQGSYEHTTISQMKTQVERPLVLRSNDSTFLALGEAALVNYARAKFKKDEVRPRAITTELASEVDLKDAGYKSPWRYVMTGKNPGQLLEQNYLVENLNEPNKIENVSWIKPGKVIREVTLTTQGGKGCIDFAQKHHLQYIEFDAGWYGHEYEDDADASTITVDPKRSPGPLDLHEVIAYGKEKNIGVILYVNRRAMEKQLDQILPLYEKWGIAGVKYGFVNVGSQDWTIWLHEAVRKAAQYHLMVDIHDEYRPTGYSRTYPNLMSQEGIRGDEESPSITQSITTLFTRMVAGAGDYTNCYLAPRVSQSMGGKTAQMAKSILLYSPWQFLYWYDRPEASPHKSGGAGNNDKWLNDSENLSFYDALPTIWDETIVLESDMEDFATIARRSGDEWFLGSLAANHERQLEIPLGFLDDHDQYEATMYFQDLKGLENNKISTTKMGVNRSTILTQKLEKNSGLAVILKKIQPK